MFPRKYFAGVFSLFLVLSLSAAEEAQYYNVTFGSPPHAVGAPPVTTGGSDSPSAIIFGRPTVVSQFGHLQDQPLVFTARGYEQIQFNLGQHAPNYFIEFDFETHNLNSSLFHFTTHFDTPTVQNVDLHGFYNTVSFGGARFPSIPWTDDALHHLRIDADIPNRLFTVTLDNSAFIVGPFTAQSGDVQSLRLNLTTWRVGTPDDLTVQVGIDNVIIGTVLPIPEPSTYALLGLGLIVVAARQMYRAKDRSLGSSPRLAPLRKYSKTCAWPK